MSAAASTSTSLKQTRRPVRRAAPCRARRRARGPPASRRLPERATRRDLFTRRSLPGAAVRAADRRATSTSLGARCGAAPRRSPARLAVAPTARAALLESRPRSRRSSTLHHKARALEVQLADVRLRRGSSKAEAFRVLPPTRELRPGDARRPRRWPTTRTSTTSSRTPPIECHRDHLMVGRHAVKVLSMKEPPAQTFAHMLADLVALPGQFIACLEWQRMPSRPRAARHPVAASALLQQARLAHQLRVVGDAARGDARRRLRGRDGAAARATR